MDAAEFWFLDYGDGIKKQPKPKIGSSITKGISRMVGWRDLGKKESRQESDRGARQDALVLFECGEERVEGLEADRDKN